MKPSEKFKFNQEKLDACYEFMLEWIAHTCEEVLMKTILFVADVEHLNKYGRVISGVDWYLKNGNIETDNKCTIGRRLKSYDEYMGYLTETDKEILQETMEDRIDLEFDFTILPKGEIHLEDMPIDKEVLQDLEGLSIGKIVL